MGYAPTEKTPGLLNQLIRFNAVQQALMYLSAALAGRPYMGIGKNLSYRQRLFFRNKGFTSHYGMAEGDDDLFVSQVATRKNTSVQIDPENTVRCFAPSSFGIWARRQSRRYSTIGLHRRGARAFAALHYWSQFLFYGCFIALWFLPAAFSLSVDVPYMAYYLPTLAVLFLMRYISQMVIYRSATRRLGERGLLPGLIFWDFLFAILTPILRLSGRMGKD